MPPNDVAPAAPAPAAPAPALPGGLEPTIANFGDVMSARSAAPAPAPVAPAAPAAPQAPQQQAQQMSAELEAEHKRFEQPQLDPNDPAAQAQQQAPDPWAEELHGVTARELIEAIRKKEIPEKLLDVLEAGIKVNGQPGRVTLRDALDGRMMHADYTKAKMALSEQERAFVADQQAWRKIFEGWEQPDGAAFGKHLDQTGMMPTVRQLVTQKWGTPEQPNIDAYVEDMHRLGHWGTFEKAARAFARQHDALMEQFGGYPNTGDAARDAAAAQRAEGLVKQWYADQSKVWSKQVELDKTIDQQKRAEWRRQREQMMRQPQQQQNAGGEAFLRSVHDLKTAEYQRLGITPEQGVELDSSFANHFRVHADYLHRQSGGQRPDLALVVRNAVRGALSAFGDRRAVFGGGNGTEQQPAPAQQQPAAPTGLPVRPTAAPTTTAAAIPQGGTIADLETRLQALNSMRR